MNAESSYVLGRHAVVTVWLEGIIDLELADFIAQNVIGNLTINPKESGFVSPSGLSTA